MTENILDWFIENEYGETEEELKYMIRKGYWVNNSVIRDKNAEKPCNKLGWCPYGTLVENYPLHEQERQLAIENNKYYKDVPINNFGHVKLVSCNKDDPEASPDLNWAFKQLQEKGTKTLSCGVFGHDCPVYYLKENTKE